MKLQLRDGHDQLQCALERLMHRPAQHLPFVLVQAGEDFVQFAGSFGEPLLLDCPPLGIKRRVPLAGAAQLALECLRRQGVSPLAELEIQEAGCREAYS